MKPTYNDKLIAYLALISGLAISGVAEYYSIMGLIAIYPAAFLPIVIMGVVLGLGKITGTVWLKQNWDFAPKFLKLYILPAIIVLMMITSLGVFGFLSKAHSDQSLVSGDVQAKVAIYDEKIKTAKENIDANRKALKQMDESVDQVMGRSQDEKGADKAVALRRGQAKERTRLLSEITAEQKVIAQLSEERAPIAAEVRKVEAEVGPIKYIAHLLYGENPDANVLEKAVIWVTVLIVIVLDPLAVIMLLASQYSFQRFREQEEDQEIKDWFEQGKERARQLDEDAKLAEGDSPQEPDIVSTSTVTDYEPDDGPLTEEQVEQIKQDAEEHLPTGAITTSTTLFPEYQFIGEDQEPDHIEQWNRMLEGAEAEVAKEHGTTITHTENGMIIEDGAGLDVLEVHPDEGYVGIQDMERPGDYLSTSTGYVQNEEQTSETAKWKEISSITENTYIETARAHMINEFAERVLSGAIAKEDLPNDIRNDVVHRAAHLRDVLANQKKEDMINSLATQVKSGLILMEQIPEKFQADVKAKLDA